METTHETEKLDISDTVAEITNVISKHLTKVIEKSKFTYEAFLYRGCANFYLKEFEQSIVDFSKSEIHERTLRMRKLVGESSNQLSGLSLEMRV